MAAARADDTDDGATATGRSGGAVGAPADVDDFHPASVWGDDDEVTTAIPVLGRAAADADMLTWLLAA